MQAMIKASWMQPCSDPATTRAAAKLLTRDEARRIAANIAKLPELVRRDD